MITDEETKSAISENISILLDQQGHSRYWLMQQIGMTEGGFYPIVRGEVVPSVAISARIAEVLGVKIDDLLKTPEATSKTSKKKLRKTA